MTRLSREDIVSGAGRRFATHGYLGTSMRDLGDDLGILGSSIYSHVGGKQELLVAVVERGAMFFEDSAASALSRGGTPADTMRWLISGHIDVLLDHRAEARTYLTEVSFLEPGPRGRINAMRDSYELAFRGTIESGIESGAFRSNCDPTLAAIYTLSILNAVDRWYNEDGRLSREQIAADMYDFVVRSIA